MAISREHRELLGRIRPVNVPTVLCEDCNPSLDGKTIEHDETCPVFLAVEQATDGDRAFFEAHPNADFYYREVTWGEGAQLILISERLRDLPGDVRLRATGKVRVEQIETGVRARKYDSVYFIPQIT